MPAPRSSLNPALVVVTILLLIGLIGWFISPDIASPTTPTSEGATATQTLPAAPPSPTTSPGPHPGPASSQPAFNRLATLLSQPSLPQSPSALSTDLTDHTAFHDLLLQARRELPLQLSEADRAQFTQLIRTLGALQQDALQQRAAAENLSLGGTAPDGRGYALTGFDGPDPIYTWTLNQTSARSINVDRVRRSSAIDPQFGPFLDGGSLVVNVNDHGEIWPHLEFNRPDGSNRLIMREVPAYTGGSRNHMTHVAGTIAAHGYNANALGMAPSLRLRTLIQQTAEHIYWYAMWQPIENNRSSAANTSLGRSGDGTYTSTSAFYDNALYDHPYYLHFYAAGNDGADGFVTINADHQIAKNFLTIGSVNAANRNAEGILTGGATISSFSSRGPTADGRIKPDLVAQGQGVVSTTGTTGYSSSSGTSMAAPAATGAAALLMEYYHIRFPGQFLRANTVRTLLIHTADDLGLPGPDYTYGWGLVNAGAALSHLKNHADHPQQRTLVEATLSPGTAWVETYHSWGEDARLTLTWTDPPGHISTGPTDRTPSLTNNLHLRLIDTEGNTYYPWVKPYTEGTADHPAFSPALFNVPATTGENNRDPVNQIVIPNLPAGTYRVEVSHTGSLASDVPQPFALAVSGLTTNRSFPSPSITATTESSADERMVFFEIIGEHFLPGAQVFLERAGVAPVPLRSLAITPDRITGTLNAHTTEPGLWDVVVINPDGQQARRIDGFLRRAVAESVYFHTHFDGPATSTFTLEGDWQIGPPTGQQGNPERPVRGENILGYNLSGPYANNLEAPRYATFPPIDIAGSSGLRLEFMRWLQVERWEWDRASLEISLNGGPWFTLLRNPSGFEFIDTAWAETIVPLPPEAEGANTLQLRFAMGPTDFMINLPGWSVDDLTVRSIDASALPPRWLSPAPTGYLRVDEPFAHTLQAEDPDTPGENLSFLLGGAPAWISLSDNGDGTAQLSALLPPGITGPVTFLLGVNDGTYTTWQNASLYALPAPDTATDWMRRAWEAEYGSLPLGDIAEILLQDSNANGIPNLLEYALGGAAFDGSTTPRPQMSQILTPEGTPRLQLSLEKNPAATDIRYVFETSTDLIEWSAHNPDLEITEDTPLRTTITLPYTTPSGDRRFLRLRAELVDE